MRWSWSEASTMSGECGQKEWFFLTNAALSFSWPVGRTVASPARPPPSSHGQESSSCIFLLLSEHNSGWTGVVVFWILGFLRLLPGRMFAVSLAVHCFRVCNIIWSPANVGGGCLDYSTAMILLRLICTLYHIRSDILSWSHMFHVYL